ncbi:MAG: hypothetical protein AB1349_12260 [Elusimicrobiota bacterium]
MLIKLLTVFMGACILTVIEVANGFATLVKRNKLQASFWGFLNWIFIGLVIINIPDGTFAKYLFTLIAGLGAGVGNFLGGVVILGC